MNIVHRYLQTAAADSRCYGDQATTRAILDQFLQIIKQFFDPTSEPHKKILKAEIEKVLHRNDEEDLYLPPLKIPSL